MPATTNGANEMTADQIAREIVRVATVNGFDVQSVHRGHYCACDRAWNVELGGTWEHSAKRHWYTFTAWIEDGRIMVEF